MTDHPPAPAGPALPATTRAWRLKSRGPPTDPGRMEQVPDMPLPALQPGCALIKIEYAALNPVDWKLAAMLPFFMQATPRTLGFDLSARVVDFLPPTGTAGGNNRCKNLQKGQLVYGLFTADNVIIKRETQGSLQKHAVVPLSHLSPIPSPSEASSEAGQARTPATRLNAEQAGGLALVALTALDMVRQVKKGDRVLLLGGTTAVGLVLADMLRAPKVGVFWITATASGAKVETLKSRGKVDEVLDYRARDVPTLLKERCAPAESQPYDIILDCVGELRIYKQCAAFLKPEGLYANVGAPLSPDQGVLRSIFTLLAGLLSSSLPRWAGGVGRKYATLKLVYTEDRWDELNEFLARGDIQPVTDQVFPWEEAPNAFARLMTGRTLGKVLVNVRGSD